MRSRLTQPLVVDSVLAYSFECCRQRLLRQLRYRRLLNIDDLAELHDLLKSMPLDVAERARLANTLQNVASYQQRREDGAVRYELMAFFRHLQNCSRSADVQAAPLRNPAGLPTFETRRRMT